MTGKGRELPDMMETSKVDILCVLGREVRARAIKGDSRSAMV